MALHVIATFTIRPNELPQAKEILAGAVEPIRNDPGCLRCHLVANNDNNNELLFLEEWKDEAALKRHLDDPTIGEIVTQVEPLLQHPFTLQTFTPL